MPSQDTKQTPAYDDRKFLARKENSTGMNRNGILDHQKQLYTYNLCTKYKGPGDVEGGV